MAKKLNTFVHVVERDENGNTTNSGTFGPGDDLSKPENAWVEKAITNPAVWDDDGEGDSGEDAAPSAGEATSPSRSARRGKGSGGE